MYAYQNKSWQNSGRKKRINRSRKPCLLVSCTHDIWGGLRANARESSFTEGGLKYQSEALRVLHA
eukprot:2842801-Amphidinium_carterae.1